MINLTEKERNTLEDITRDDFYGDGVYSALWTELFLDFSSRYNSKITIGVLSSLAKKNVIKVATGKYGVMFFTDFGKQVMRELGY